MCPSRRHEATAGGSIRGGDSDAGDVTAVAVAEPAGGEDTRIVRLDPIAEQAESQTPESRRYRARLFAKSPARNIDIFSGAMCRRIALRRSSGVSASMAASCCATNSMVRSRDRL